MKLHNYIIISLTVFSPKNEIPSEQILLRLQRHYSILLGSLNLDSNLSINSTPPFYLT